PQAQLSLPLDCSRSDPAGDLQNPSRSRAKLRRESRGLLESSLATHGQHGIVQVSSKKDNIAKFIRQCQPFRLTPSISAIIDKVNQNGWPYIVSALPPFHCGTFAKFSESRPHVGRGSPLCLPPNPLD